MNVEFCLCEGKERNASYRGKGPISGRCVALGCNGRGYEAGSVLDHQLRDAETAKDFMVDLSSRLNNRVQLTTDGLKAYLEAVDYAFSGFVDYSMLVKIYGSDPEGEKRYSPAKCIGCERKRIVGDPDPNHISTSYIERQNLSVRMTNRRFTRLTNAFSKRIENHMAAVALGYFAYNFIKIHRTLRVTSCNGR